MDLSPDAPFREICLNMEVRLVNTFVKKDSNPPKEYKNCRNMSFGEYSFYYKVKNRKNVNFDLQPVFKYDEFLTSIKDFIIKNKKREYFLRLYNKNNILLNTKELLWNELKNFKSLMRFDVIPTKRNPNDPTLNNNDNEDQYPGLPLTCYLFNKTVCSKLLPFIDDPNEKELAEIFLKYGSMNKAAVKEPLKREVFLANDSISDINSHDILSNPNDIHVPLFNFDDHSLQLMSNNNNINNIDNCSNKSRNSILRNDLFSSTLLTCSNPYNLIQTRNSETVTSYNMNNNIQSGNSVRPTNTCRGGIISQNNITESIMGQENTTVVMGDRAYVMVTIPVEIKDKIQDFVKFLEQKRNKDSGEICPFCGKRYHDE